MAVVYEEQNTDISWYANEIGGGAAKDNFQRIIELRKAFCHPLTINKDGTLNEKYFSTQNKETAMNWNDIELLQLYEGIYKHGVDCVEKWIKIQSDFLPQRDFIEVRLKLSQLFGVQDLSIYGNRTFSTEKEVTVEYEKNKKESQENGTWKKKCAVALKAEVSALNNSETQECEKKELEDWNKNVYNNPIYIYRTNKNDRKKTRKSKNDKNTKKSAKKGKVQKNTIDQMLKKKVDLEPISEKNDVESMEVDENENKNKNKSKNKNVKNKNKKAAKKKPKSKKVPLLPVEDSDEEMLCVE